MVEIILNLPIKKPIKRIFRSPQGQRNIKSPKNRKRRKKKRKRKNTDVIALVLSLSSANASQEQSRNQSLSTSLSMKNRKSVRNQQRQQKMNSRRLMPVQFETSGNDPRKMMRRTTSSIRCAKIFDFSVWYQKLMHSLYITSIDIQYLPILILFI